MADTAYGVNAPEAQKLWRSQLAREALKATWVQKMIGDSSDSVVQVLPETKKDAGDRVRVTLRMQLNGDGVGGDGTLEGNEEALATFTDDLLIDQLRHAVRSAGKMTQQRIPWSIREEAMLGLKDWWAGRLDTWFFNQMCGFTPVTDQRYSGNNAIVGPDALHISRPNAKANDQSLAAGDEFKLSLIDQAVAAAKLGGYGNPVNGVPIRPVKINGADHWVGVLHTNQVVQLRADIGTGGWVDIQKAAVTGDGSSKNPIFTGAIGMYNGVILHESTRITQGVNSVSGAAFPNSRRFVLLGAQAGAIGFGKGYSFNDFDWNEELFDYGNKLGVEAGLIGGLKKLRFNNADFGALVMSTFTP
jgi:N4-gp56 family major capsid protein